MSSYYWKRKYVEKTMSNFLRKVVLSYWNKFSGNVYRSNISHHPIIFTFHIHYTLTTFHDYDMVGHKKGSLLFVFNNTLFYIWCYYDDNGYNAVGSSFSKPILDIILKYVYAAIRNFHFMGIFLMPRINNNLFLRYFYFN